MKNINKFKKERKQDTMTKKCFAALLSAQELTAEIKQLTDEVKEKGVCVAYKNLMKIAELNDKYHADFFGVDPYWSPENAKKQAKANAETAPAAAAPKAEPAPAPVAPAKAPAYNYAVEENFM